MGHKLRDPARACLGNRRIQLSAILKAVADIGTSRTLDPTRSDDLHKRVRNTAIKLLAVAGLGMMQVMMVTLPTYSATDLAADTRVLMRWASLNALRLSRA